MQLKVLGTVSPYSKEEKNCPGFLVTNENNKILLDCGNGITRNLNFPEDLNNLTIIISHLHRDHYSDIFSIAYATYVYHNLGHLKDRIKVYIPFDETSPDYYLLNNLGEEHYLEILSYNKDSLINLENTTISFSENPHNIISHSIKVTSNNQIIVYSGDTGYMGNSIEHFAKGANLLICESTFLKGQTRKKDYHLYAHEAATIAKKAEVEQLLLTHFWPEISPILYKEEAQTIFKNTESAQEKQVINLSLKK